MKIYNKGFTLIEIMVVIIIIGILVAIAIPNFLASQDRAREAQLKANMHVIQQAEELYGTDFNGQYVTLDVLTTQNYWKEIQNPFTLNRGSGLSYYSGNLTSVSDLKDNDNNGGLIGAEITASYRYYIYGSNKNADDYIKINGATLYLSNS